MASYEQKRKLENIETLISNAEKTFSAQFRRELPDTIENIAKKYATRRKNPYISDAIKPEIKELMLDYRLTDENYLKTLLYIAHDLFREKPTNANKKAFIVAAQTGAGKTALRTQILREYPGAIVINYDLFKKYRPDCEKIREINPAYFGALTGIDSYDHGSDIMDMALDLGYDILIESAPSSRDGLVNVNLEKMARAGYDLDFNILAVGDLVSALGVHIRYEQAIIENLPDAKLTDLARHNDSYNALEKIVEDFSDKNLIRVYRRGTEEENRVPQQIICPEGRELEALREERKRSNFEYASMEKGRDKSNFERDYLYVLSMMENRQFSNTELGQIKKVYSQYEHFCLDNSVLYTSRSSKKKDFNDSGTPGGGDVR